ncbi:DUF4148 domain-containing protein [Cupriavidus sp. D39]|uniref:DUF4148 domain-containing protein n=1 Tax=Cupriavidus sp. D39 TaxID=2997877 RepID=UPI002270C2D4|nr:DUF4148 domain-containing protein [Cupriavidus sp. D39]MCY0856330.1 DUF4148 domain-containing protein [Cupriavidus sp. D39]
MKSNSLIRLFVLRMRGSLIVSAALMATSLCVHAQTSPAPATHQVTRAEVLHELEELESVGYNPSQGDNGDYPADLQAAERKLEAKHQAEKDALMGGNQAAKTAESQPAQTKQVP